jgi:hypothetical protein
MIDIVNVTGYVWQGIKNLSWILQLPEIWFWKQNFINSFSQKNKK